MPQNGATVTFLLRLPGWSAQRGAVCVWISGSGGWYCRDGCGVGGPVTSANPGKVEPVDVVSYP